MQITRPDPPGFSRFPFSITIARFNSALLFFRHRAAALSRILIGLACITVQRFALRCDNFAKREEPMDRGEECGRRTGANCLDMVIRRAIRRVRKRGRSAKSKPFASPNMAVALFRSRTVELSVIEQLERATAL